MDWQLPGEVWRDVVGWEGRYEVSNLGRVRRKGHHIMGQWKNTAGYLVVRLSMLKRGKRAMAFVHRLVAMAFIPNPRNDPCVNHLDFDKANNCVPNLEWCTQGDNLKHSHRAGRMYRTPKGHLSTKRVLTPELVSFVKNDYRGGNVTYRMLAAKYCVSRRVIGRAIDGLYDTPPPVEKE